MANTLHGRPPSLGKRNPTRVRMAATQGRLELLLVAEDLDGPNVAHLTTPLRLNVKVRYAILDDAQIPATSTYPHMAYTRE